MVRYTNRRHTESATDVSTECRALPQSFEGTSRAAVDFRRALDR